MAKQAKRSTNKPEMKINGILIGLIASVIVNLLLAAPYVAFLTTRQLDVAAGGAFFSRVLDGDEVKVADRSWTCMKGIYTPDLTVKNQRACYGLIYIDENNQEIR